MASNTLTDTNISDTYTGLLHSRAEPLPVSGQVLIYDGGGNPSALKTGRAGQGVTVSGLLSAGSLSVHDLTYPSQDSSAGNFLRTDGDGQLYFSSFPLSSIPALSPDPAGTYTSLSAITVNSQGQITNVITAAGGAAAYAQVSLYVTPITLYTQIGNGDVTTTVSCAQSNMPAGSNYAILQIYNELGFYTPGNSTCYSAVNIDGVTASLVGSVNNATASSGSHGATDLAIYYAKMDGSNNISVNLNRWYASNSSSRYSQVQIKLLGYATFNTLSNP